MRWRISEAGIFWLVGLVVTLVQLASLAAAPDMIGDDYAAYIQNARALLSDAPYALPGYMVNPAVDAGPAAYPPGLALLLAWPVHLFGADFTVLAAVNALCIGVFARLFASWLRRSQPLLAAAAGALLVGLCPFFIAFHNVVASEFLFVLLLFAGFLAQLRVEAGTSRYGGAALAGLLFGAAVATRVAGAPVLLAGLLADWRRRFGWAGVVTLALGGAIAAGAIAMASPGILWHYQANVSADTAASGGPGGVLLGNLLSLPGRLSVLWSYAGQGPQPAVPMPLDLLRKAATVILLLAGFAGLGLRLRRGPGAAEVFFVLTLLALMLTPPVMAGPRLLLPLSLLLLGYALEAAARLRWAVLLVLLLGSAVSWSAMATAPANRLTATETRAQALYTWLRNVPPPDETVLARRARAIAFFTGRTAEDWDQTHADAVFLKWAAARNARLLVLQIDQLGAGADEAAMGRALDAWEAGFFGARRGDFELVFTNTRFRVYRIPPS